MFYYSYGEIKKCMATLPNKTSHCFTITTSGTEGDSSSNLFTHRTAVIHKIVINDLIFPLTSTLLYMYTSVQSMYVYKVTANGLGR